MIDATGEGDYVDADDSFGRYVESSLSTSQDKMQGALPEISWSGENRKDVLLARSEEVVVPELNQRFGQYGFSFEETGVGDAIIAYAPDIKDKEGNIIEKGATKEFNLDAWFDSSNVEETEALKKWMYENKPKQEEIDAIEEKELAIFDAEDMSDRFALIEKENLQLDEAYKELEKDTRAYERLSFRKRQGEILGEAEINFMSDYESNRSQFQIQLENYTEKKKELDQLAGEYTAMKAEKGYWGVGAFYNAAMDGFARIAADNANVGIDLMSLIAPSVMTDPLSRGALEQEYYDKIKLDMDATRSGTPYFKIKKDGTRIVATQDDIALFNRQQKQGYKPKDGEETDFWIEKTSWEEIDNEAKAYALDKVKKDVKYGYKDDEGCLLYTSPSPRDRQKSRMPSSA